LAGVDNLSARRRYGKDDDPISKALTDRPPGTTVFLSHKPLHANRVANVGGDLMLCGHTHGGQIWPFDYLVRQEYPLAVENVTLAIKQTEKIGLIGDNILGSGFDFKITLHQGAGAFVCGEETALLASLEGKAGEPKPRPPFP